MLQYVFLLCSKLWWVLFIFSNCHSMVLLYSYLPFQIYLLYQLIYAFNWFHLYSSDMSMQFSPFFRSFPFLHLKFFILMILSSFENLWFFSYFSYAIPLDSTSHVSFARLEGSKLSRLL